MTEIINSCECLHGRKTSPSSILQHCDWLKNTSTVKVKRPKNCTKHISFIGFHYLPHLLARNKTLLRKMKMGAQYCLVFWIFAMLICMAMTYTIPDDGLLLTGDTKSTIDNVDRAEKATADDNLGLAARKRFSETLRKPSLMDTPTFEDFRTLVDTLATNMEKRDARTLLPDRRAHMNDAFKTITELLIANAEKLENIMTKLDEFETISDMQKANADTLDTLTGDVEMMKSEIMTKLDTCTFNMISDMQKANTEKLDNLTSVTDKTANMNDQFKKISDVLKANVRKLDYLTKYVAREEGHSSCLDYQKAGYTTSGQYMISIPNTFELLNVYCDQDTDGGGWLVFQRRRDGSVDFYRDWVDYKAGFGEITSEFWLGNDYLHTLTRDQQELRVDLMDFQGNTAYAKYSTFTVKSEAEKYALNVKGYSGTAKDSLTYNSGFAFSTKDRDNDGRTHGSCALQRKGAWWYGSCTASNLNGIYYYSSAKNDHSGVTWFFWKGHYVPLMKAEMKIRPKQ